MSEKVMTVQQVSGVLNIDKPSGITSHDVVARIRRITGIKRIGHAGTLDPLATGVLLVCVGQATRISSYLQTERKLYRTTVRLGEETTTYDAEGEQVQKRPVPDLDEKALDSALTPFRGPILQVPPMYSALKRDGRPLHELARAGVVVERQAREVTIYDIAIESWDAPDLTLRISCSTGTYVRSLAHDLGESLGCGGHVIALRRLASGTWRTEDAVTLEELSAAGERWIDFLHGLRASLSMLPPLILPATEAYRFSLGQRLLIPALEADAEVCVFAPDERLIGIGRFDAETSVLAPYKIFADPNTLVPERG